jgi:hypothetical protein
MVRALAEKLMQSEQPGLPGSRDKTRNIFFSCAIATATLWDFRIDDVRIFDTVSLIFLFGFLLLSHKSFDKWMQDRRDYIVLFATIIGYAAVGYFLHHHRSSVAVVFFASLALYLTQLVRPTRYERVYRALVWMHVILFSVQYLSYVLFNRLINFSAGSDFSRIVSGVQFKPSGLFQEANSFCVNIFILATLAMVCRPNRLLNAIAALAMMISGSLWGLGAAFVLMLLCELRMGGTIAVQARTFCIAFLVIFGLFNVHLWLEKPLEKSLPYLYLRIADIYSDSSARERYVANTVPTSRCQHRMLVVPVATQRLHSSFRAKSLCLQAKA